MTADSPAGREAAVASVVSALAELDVDPADVSDEILDLLTHVAMHALVLAAEVVADYYVPRSAE